MIVEKILGKLEKTGKKIEFVTIDWFERDKKRLRKTTTAGEEIGIASDRPLNEGDILYEDSERVIAVTIAPCDLISVRIGSITEMGRLCFELGNRHLSLSITETNVKCPYDAPTFEYLKKLGFDAVRTHEKFADYIECRGHAHTSAHDHPHEPHHAH